MVLKVEPVKGLGWNLWKAIFKRHVIRDFLQNDGRISDHIEFKIQCVEH